MIGSKFEKEILILHKNKLNNRTIAKEIGVHHNTVSYWLRKNGLNSNFCNQPIKMIGKLKAECSKCFKIKSINEFQYGRKNQKYEYKFSYCNDCRKKQVYLNLNSNIERYLNNIFNRLKLRAKNHNIPFNLSKEFFQKQYVNQKGKCFYTEEKLNSFVGNGLQRNSLSVDKIIPEKGYVIGNVVLCTHKVNSIKSDLTLIELKKWIPKWYIKIKNFNNYK